MADHAQHWSSIHPGPSSRRHFPVRWASRSAEGRSLRSQCRCCTECIRYRCRRHRTSRRGHTAHTSRRTERAAAMEVEVEDWVTAVPRRRNRCSQSRERKMKTLSRDRHRRIRHRRSNRRCLGSPSAAGGKVVRHEEVVEPGGLAVERRGRRSIRSRACHRRLWCSRNRHRAIGSVRMRSRRDHPATPPARKPRAGCCRRSAMVTTTTAGRRHNRSAGATCRTGTRIDAARSTVPMAALRRWEAGLAPPSARSPRSRRRRRSSDTRSPRRHLLSGVTQSELRQSQGKMRNDSGKGRRMGNTISQQWRP